jgi:hypothetical protein
MDECALHKVVEERIVGQQARIDRMIEVMAANDKSIALVIQKIDDHTSGSLARDKQRSQEVSSGTFWSKFASATTLIAVIGGAIAWGNMTATVKKNTEFIWSDRVQENFKEIAVIKYQLDRLTSESESRTKHDVDIKN